MAPPEEWHQECLSFLINVFAPPPQGIWTKVQLPDDDKKVRLAGTLC